MTLFDWTKLVLVDFLVPIAWPVVALVALWIVRTELQAIVQKVGDALARLVDRTTKAKIRSVAEIEAHVSKLPEPGVETVQTPRAKDRKD